MLHHRLAVPVLLAVLVGAGAATALAEDTTPPGPAPTEDPAVALVTLRDAAAAGDLEVQGFDPESYRRVHVRMRNRTKRPLAVDICGSHLEPRPRRSCQRLGLGPVVTPRVSRRAGPGTVVIDLEPGEEKTIEVNTCCLDAGKPAPGSHLFRAAEEPLPPVREKVLRWWADNPDAPQGAVNRAIWQFRDEVFLTKRNRGVYVQPPRTAAAHAGTHYLIRGGELMARDPDGIERFLGTDVFAVHPTDAAVFAVALGTPAQRGARPPVELWRLLHTGEKPWQMICRLPDDLRVDDVQVGPAGHVLLVTSKGLYRADAALGTLDRLVATEETDCLSLRFREDGPAEVTLRRQADRGYYQGGQLKGAKMPVCELWHLGLVDGRHERVEEFWNVRQVRIGEAGIYALTPGGKMRRWQGRSFRSISGRVAYERILHVGRTHVWLQSAHGNLVATDAGGRLQFKAGPHVQSIRSIDWDDHTDEAVYADQRGFYRIEPDGGRRELIVEDRRPR